MWVEDGRRGLPKETVVRGLRCKNEHCEDGEYTFEFGQETDADFMLLPVVLRMEERFDEEKTRQHTFQSLGSEGNEVTGSYLM